MGLMLATGNAQPGRPRHVPRTAREWSPLMLENSLATEVHRWPGHASTIVWWMPSRLRPGQLARLSRLWGSAARCVPEPRQYEPMAGHHMGWMSPPQIARQQTAALWAVSAGHAGAMLPMEGDRGAARLGDAPLIHTLVITRHKT